MSDMPEFVLAIDGGQTSTKGALADHAGRIVARVTAAPWDAMANENGRERCRAALEEVLGRLLPAIPPGGRLVSACLGLTGGRTGAALVEEWFRERAQPVHFSLVGDPVTNLRGADPSGAAGVVVIAGGGSVAWGHDGRGREALAGAHGYLLDDEGSGYELGRRAIIAVLKAHHGRRPATLLTDAVLRSLGLGDPWELRMSVYNGRAGLPEVAGLVPAIAEAARLRDAAALTILTDGARDLADMAAAVVGQLALTKAPVYPTGGVFRVGDLILQPFSERLRQLAPDACVAQPVLPPLGGALVMALEMAGALSAEAIANVAAACCDQ